MSTPGKLTARPPTSPHANLAVQARIGTASRGSAIWSLTCTCGATLQASAPTIKSGVAKCDACNPSATATQIVAVLAALPGTYEQIERRDKLSFGKVRYALELMRAGGKCFVGDWTRADAQGSYRPIFHAGAKDDVPCPLAPVPVEVSKRKYDKRVKNAIQKALEGGKEDPRYIRHISREIANQTAARARVAPQHWFAALEVSHA